MCKLGDIIVIKKYIGDDNRTINSHSFVVINDQPSFIEGLRYDFVANVMSSFKNNKHRNKKLRFIENIEIISKDIISNNKNNKNGFIKADQLFYFDKNNIDYYVLGRISEYLLNELLTLIILLDKQNKLKQNIENLNN